MIGNYQLGDGFAETMTRREMAIAYPSLSPETHWLVDLWLDNFIQEGHGHRFVHSYIDTPALAIQAIKVNVGFTLPTFEDVYRYGRGEGYKQVGETRVITPEDAFKISEGPTAAANSRQFISTVSLESDNPVRQEPIPVASEELVQLIKTHVTRV